MAKLSHPDRFKVTKFVIENPDILYRDVAQQFNVPESSIVEWMNLHRKKFEKETPVRAADRKRNPVVAEQKVLDPELTELARKAARNALTKLSDLKFLATAKPLEVANILKILTDSYNLLSPMDGKSDQSKVPDAVVSALLGKLDK